MCVCVHVYACVPFLWLLGSDVAVVVVTTPPPIADTSLEVFVYFEPAPIDNHGPVQPFDNNVHTLAFLMC